MGFWSSLGTISSSSNTLNSQIDSDLEQVKRAAIKKNHQDLKKEIEDDRQAMAKKHAEFEKMSCSLKGKEK